MSNVITTSDIVTQLEEGAVRSIGWIGDGSSAKAYVGRLVSVHAERRGLVVKVRNDATGRIVRVVWRMSASMANAIVRCVDALDEARIEATRMLAVALGRGFNARLSVSGTAIVIDDTHYVVSRHQLDRVTDYLTR